MAEGTPTLGQKVRFSIHLERDWRVPTGENAWGRFAMKVWQAVAGPIREGIVVGVRTLSNGKRDMGEDYANYTAKEHFKAYIVAYDMRRKPMMVRPEDLEIVDDAPDPS